VKWIGKGTPSAGGYAPQDFRGKVVLLAFLDEARPSDRVLRELNSLHQKWAERGLVVLRIYDESVPGDAGRYLPCPAAIASPGVLADGSSAAAEKYGVKARPMLFLIDREGILRHADVESDQLRPLVESLLKP
jgi:hypothetical protein